MFDRPRNKIRGIASHPENVASWKLKGSQRIVSVFYLSHLHRRGRICGSVETSTCAAPYRSYLIESKHGIALVVQPRR